MKVPREERGTLPKYLPGDIVETLDGEFGVIVQAHVTINGSTVYWHQNLPETITSSWAPCYALSPIPGFNKPRKEAWWDADEWKRVVSGSVPMLLALKSATP